MIIPGELIAFLTFPGVIVHEIGHQLMCRWFRVAVIDVCYYRWGNPAGYVVHEPPRTQFQSLLIGIAPFLANTVIGAIIALPAAIPVFTFESGSVVDYVLIWLGVSITMHAFPSTGDAASIWAAVRSRGTGLATRVIATPIVGLIYLGALGSFFWLDLFYGIAVAAALPAALVRIL
jgi:hypothetical protein